MKLTDGRNCNEEYIDSKITVIIIETEVNSVKEREEMTVSRENTINNKYKVKEIKR